MKNVWVNKFTLGVVFYVTMSTVEKQFVLTKRNDLMTSFLETVVAVICRFLLIFLYGIN